MNILVTGAAGFIGSHMAEKLALLGHKVTGADNLSNYYSRELKLENINSLQKNNVEFIEIDLRDAEQYNRLSKNYEYVFHFAAQPGLSETSTFYDYLSNNVSATHELIEFSRQCSNINLFVNIATSSVYGLDATKNETAVAQPVSFYGVTKLAAEQMVLAACRNNSLQACSLRLYSVYGPRERPDKLYTKLIRSALFNEPFTLIEGSLQHKRSFTFISDIVEGVLQVMGKEKQVNNEIFNIGTDVQHTTAEGIETVEKLTGKKINFKMMPPRPGDQTTTKAVIDKARQVLNYDPVISLSDGVQQQINWFETPATGL